MTTITQQQIEERLRVVLARSGLSLEEFVKLGRDDALEDDELRDLWLMAKATLQS